MSRIELAAGPAGLLLAKFALGYLAVLAAPGPNMLAVGALAALRGFRGVLPFCLGIGAGVAALATALLLVFGALAGTEGLDRAARAVGGVLLLVVALRVIAARPPPGTAPPRVRPAGADAVAFGAGFLTALTNPVTAAYFAAQMLGPAGDLRQAWAMAPVAGLLALGFGLLVATVFAHPRARALALRRHRAACLVSGIALAALALAMLAPLAR